MADGAQSALRVLIVDEDEIVRDLLARELVGAGYEVDTLSSGNGFSEDMVRLIHPDLLLVDPFLKDVELADMARVLAALHGNGSFKLVLIDGGRDPTALSVIAQGCRADGTISKRDLLRAPADAVAEQFLPDAEVMEVVEEEALPDAVMAEEEGIEIELSPEPPQPRPPPRAPSVRLPQVGALAQPKAGDGVVAKLAVAAGLQSRVRPRAPSAGAAGKGATIAARPAAPGRVIIPPPPPPATGSPAAAAKAAAPAGRGVMSMIRGEVGEVPRVQAKVETSFRADISLFSRHNFYVGPTGDLRTGGVFVSTSTLPQVGDSVQLRVELPFRKPLETQGVVEWIRLANPLARVTPGAGVSLSKLSGEQRAELELFFKERAPLTHLPPKP